MPIKYSRNCMFCKKYYKGYGQKFCSQSCRSLFIHRCTDKKNGFQKGHTSWLKGTKGIAKPNITSFKKGDHVGDKHPNWKGGRIVTTQGYISMWTDKGRRAEHVVVAEKKLGRKLKRNECVHHINHIRTDNRPENITVMKQREHGIYHANKYWSDKKSK